MGDRRFAARPHPGQRAPVSRRVPVVRLLERRQVMDWLSQHLRPIVDSVLYSALGTAVLLVAIWWIEKVLPFSLRKEVAEDQNTALGISLCAFIIGVALIISSAIHG